MKIIRHTARDMRSALRAVREQLGEDAVILSSRRIEDGIEVTAAVDFEASNLESGDFASAPLPPAIVDAVHSSQTSAGHTPVLSPAAAAPIARNPTVLALTAPRATKSSRFEPAPAAATAVATANASQPMLQALVTPAAQPALSYDALAGAEDRELPPHYTYEPDWISEAAREAVAEHLAAQRAPVLAAADIEEPVAAEVSTPPVIDVPRPAVIEMPRPSAAPRASSAAALRSAVAPAARVTPVAPLARVAAPPAATAAHPIRPSRFEAIVDDDPVEQVREATLSPLASREAAAALAALQAPAMPGPGATDAMGSELKSLRRMLETQFAHLAWNDLTRRAPVHSELLRELTEIGISQDLAQHLVRQLPEDTDLTFARRFTLAGLSQYLKVTGDRWLDDGGRVAFVGATGVGKTTTLAKIAVRWVLRHGARDIALIAGDSVRIGAQDQLQSLAQLLGVPVYTPERFDQLPSLLSRLNERLVLIDTPGSSVRDPQLASRLAVLSNSASKLETALVLAASTQAGAIEEAVKHFAPANPACCVLTKMDEAASLGGILSVLIRAGLPVSYMSEGQRVPEDLRPARALELVSAAVRLAKASGAAADEDLLRRRFGKTAHGIS